MKTEQSLLKNPVEPVATMPSALSHGAVPAAEYLRPAAPAHARSRVYADIPPSVYMAFIACWTALVAVFWFTFAESPNAAFMVAISTAFAIMFFGVPIALYRLGYQKPVSGPSLYSFLNGRVQTLTGPLDGFDALVQVVLIPVCLTIGAAAISFIVNLDRMPN